MVLLFQAGDGPALKEIKLRQIVSEVNAFPEDYLLNTSAEDLVQYFIKKLHVEVPAMDFPNTTIEQTTVPLNVYDYGRQVMVQGAKCKFEVPFSGDADIFSMRANASDTNPPEADVHGNRISFEIIEPSLTSDQIEQRFARWKSSIAKYLDWHRALWSDFDDKISDVAATAIADRRKTVNALRNSASEAATRLGIRLKKKGDDPKTFAAPAVRRKIAPSLPAAKATGKPTAPDPTLARDIYDGIVDILRGAGRSIERSASALRQRDEEALRDVLLIPLNSHFEGAAHGEAFNKVGKTDIVVRHEKENLFVAECKIWTGSKALGEAIDQLFGYLTWRDSKAAIVIFNRNTKLSEVLEKAVAAVRAHACYVRDVRKIDDSSWEFVFKHPSDDQKLIAVTVMIFDIGSGS